MKPRDANSNDTTLYWSKLQAKILTTSIPYEIEKRAIALNIDHPITLVLFCKLINF